MLILRASEGLVAVLHEDDNHSNKDDQVEQQNDEDGAKEDPPEHTQVTNETAVGRYTHSGLQPEQKTTLLNNSIHPIAPI